MFLGTQHCLPKRNKETENIKFIVTIHDLAVEKLKNITSFTNKIIQKVFTKKSCKNADLIMADSISTKNDIVEIFKIDERKIRVVYLGINPKKNIEISSDTKKKVLNKFNIDNDCNYMYFVSSLNPRKNADTIIKAFEVFKDQHPNSTLKFVMSGGLGSRYKITLKLIQMSKYSNDIIRTGFVTEEEKQILFQNCKMFVYPSLYEGFGLPILEAMQYNVMIITSNNSSIPEIGEDAVFYLENVYDYLELEKLIEKVLNIIKEEKEKCIEKENKIVEKFTWKKCTDEIYKILMGDNK